MPGAILLSIPGMMLIVLLNMSPWGGADMFQHFLPC